MKIPSGEFPRILINIGSGNDSWQYQAITLNNADPIH